MWKYGLSKTKLCIYIFFDDRNSVKVARNTNSSFPDASFKNPITAIDHYILFYFIFFRQEKKLVWLQRRYCILAEKCQKPDQYLRCRTTAIDIRGEMAFHLKKTNHWRSAILDSVSQISNQSQVNRQRDLKCFSNLLE